MSTVGTLRDRSGVTLIELILVALLGTIVLGGLFQVMISNQKTYGAQSVAMRERQSLRAGMDLLVAELREVSPSDGDLLAMGAHAVGIRSARSVALFCQIMTPGGNPVIRARKVGRYLTGDSAHVFFENNPRSSTDDVWRTARINVVDSTGLLACPDGGAAQSLRLDGVNFASSSLGDSITPGGLIRNFTRNAYLLGTYGGDPYLMLEDSKGTRAPLAGPLRAGDGVEFLYLDESGTATTVAADVRQIEVILRASAKYVGSGGSALQDSLRFRVYTRNTN